MGCAPIRHQLDQGAPCSAARSFFSPLCRRVHREEVVSVYSQGCNTITGTARCEGLCRTTCNALKCRDRPLIVDYVENDRRAIYGSEGQCLVEIAFCGTAFAGPRRRDSVLPLDG